MRASSDWAVYNKWLTQQGLNWNQVLVDANDPDKRAIAAGMTRAVNELVKAIDSAPSILKAMTNG